MLSIQNCKFVCRALLSSAEKIIKILDQTAWKIFKILKTIHINIRTDSQGWAWAQHITPVACLDESLRLLFELSYNVPTQSAIVIQFPAFTHRTKNDTVEVRVPKTFAQILRLVNSVSSSSRSYNPICGLGLYVWLSLLLLPLLLYTEACHYQPFVVRSYQELAFCFYRRSVAWFVAISDTIDINNEMAVEANRSPTWSAPTNEGSVNCNMEP